ncbi:MAG: hypothetical protein PVF95_06930 [bacterium]
MNHEIKLAEKENLRQELQSLKDCQVRYFAVTITSAAAILGIGSQLGRPQDLTLLTLAPLLITLPCWWIFFDKATTITRIVAYVRVLEELIIAPGEARQEYIGWERALYLFRQDLQRLRPSDRLKRLGEGLKVGALHGLTFRTTHRYWVINWYTFLGISLYCIVLSHSRTGHNGYWVVFLVLFCASSLFNLSVLGRLIGGANSYDFNETSWRRLL